MPYFLHFVNGEEVGGITIGEVCLLPKALQHLDDQQIIVIVRQLEDAMREAADVIQTSTARTVEGLLADARAARQRARTQDVRRGLISVRRNEFGSARAALQLQLLERDGYVCSVEGCGCQEDLTIDHVVPLSRGGTDDLSNLAWLCRRHNSEKSDRLRQAKDPSET